MCVYIYRYSIPSRRPRANLERAGRPHPSSLPPSASVSFFFRGARPAQPVRGMRTAIQRPRSLLCSCTLHSLTLFFFLSGLGSERLLRAVPTKLFFLACVQIV